MPATLTRRRFASARPRTRRRRRGSPCRGEVERAEDEPLDARTSRDVEHVPQPGRGLDDRDDDVLGRDRGERPLDVRRAVGLRKQHTADRQRARDAEVVFEPGRERAVHAHVDGHVSWNRCGHEAAARVHFFVRRDRVLEVENHAIGAARRGLGEAVGSRRGHEQPGPSRPVALAGVDSFGGNEGASSSSGNKPRDSSRNPRLRLHRARSVVVGRPQLEMIRGVAGRAENQEVGRVECRPHRLEVKPADALRRHVRLQQIEQQRRDQRTVYDESRVPLDVRRVPPVVVNAVCVERERRKAKEERLSRPHGVSPCGIPRQRPRARSPPRGGRRRRITIHEILLLLDGDVQHPC